MGVAGFPVHATDLSSLRAAADAALYRAKEEGRNRVVCAPMPGAGWNRTARFPRKPSGASGRRTGSSSGSSRPSSTRRPFPPPRAPEPRRRLHLVHDLLRPRPAHVLPGRGPAPGPPGPRALHLPAGHLPLQLHPHPRAGPGAARGHRHGGAVRHAQALDDRGEPRRAGAAGAARRASHRDRPPPRRGQRLFRGRGLPLRHGGLLGERADRPHPAEAGRTQGPPGAPPGDGALSAQPRAGHPHRHHR